MEKSHFHFPTAEHFSPLPLVIGRMHQVKGLKNAFAKSTELLYLYLETQLLSNSFSPGAVGSNTVSTGPYLRRLNTHFVFSDSDIKSPLDLK